MSGVEDVVQEQHVAAGDVGCEPLVDDQGRGGRRRSPIAAGLHQRDPQGDLDLADQIGQRDQASRQHGDDRERLVAVVILDLPAHRLEAIPDHGLADQQFYSHGRFDYIGSTFMDSGKAGHPMNLARITPAP